MAADSSKNDQPGQQIADPRSHEDRELAEVKAELLRLDPDGERWAKVIRHTFDVIYNGRESGRYRWDQLYKTEKTHFGTLFEIYAQREFDFESGKETDYRIAGHQVDAKWSQSKGYWMLPPEVFERLALVATGEDAKSIWSLGLIRVTKEVRREKGNRDAKTQLNPLGRKSIDWLWHDAPLAPNVLLQLDRETVDEIFEPNGGTARLCKLFQAAEGMIVHRNTIETVAQQLDSQKRVRGNGGARSVIRKDGYLLLSGNYHRSIAEQLGCLVPKKDEYIAIRVKPSVGSLGATIDGCQWELAGPDDVITTPAPELK